MYKSDTDFKSEIFFTGKLDVTHFKERVMLGTFVKMFSLTYYYLNILFMIHCIR